MKPHFLLIYFCNSAACRRMFSGSQEYQMPSFYLPAATFLSITSSVGLAVGKKHLSARKGVIQNTCISLFC